jgi:hypothetical protein
MSEHRVIPDWQWLTDILSFFDITEKSTLRKNAHNFTSLEACLYTELQKRYTPRKVPHQLVRPDGTHTSEELEQAKRIHADQIATMHKMGYGLLLDGHTFYKYGYELKPWDFEQNFTMHHAYEIHRLLTETKREGVHE